MSTQVNPAGVQLNNINSFLATAQVGTGSNVAIPHGLGVTPAFVIISPVDSELADYIQGTHDATNLNIQVATDQVFSVWAIVGR